MRTNGRHRSNRSPPGDTRRLCSYCGVEWYRSELVRDASHNLAGPCCQAGRDIVTLAVGNAMLASRHSIGEPQMASDGSIDSTPTEVPPPLNWNGPPPNQQNQGPTGPLSVLVELWLRGDFVVSQGGVVSRWTDMSSRSNHCFPPGPGTAPTSSVDTDGLTMVTFDGLLQRLIASNPQSSRPTWVWAMCGFPTIGIPAQIALRANVGIAVGGGNIIRVVGTSFGTLGIINPATWVRASIVADLADATNRLSFLSSSVDTAGVGQINSLRTILGAGTAAGGQPANVSFKELILTAGIPTATEIAAIETYGMLRYGAAPFT